MKGDKSKLMGIFSRWIDHFWDGMYGLTKKGKRKVPSQHFDKKYEKRWRRREFKKFKKDIEEE